MHSDKNINILSVFPYVARVTHYYIRRLPALGLKSKFFYLPLPPGYPKFIKINLANLVQPFDQLLMFKMQSEKL